MKFKKIVFILKIVIINIVISFFLNMFFPEFIESEYVYFISNNFMQYILFGLIYSLLGLVLAKETLRWSFKRRTATVTSIFLITRVFVLYINNISYEVFSQTYPKIIIHILLLSFGVSYIIEKNKLK